MSAVQSCLESKEMASSNKVDFLDSFTTIDEEEKDSDEESFHLFLDGDDELNKSDDKSQSNEIEEYPSENNEEKEEVNELPSSEENNSIYQEPNLAKVDDEQAVEDDQKEEKSEHEQKLEEQSEKSEEESKQSEENEKSEKKIEAPEEPEQIQTNLIECDKSSTIILENAKNSKNEIDQDDGKGVQCLPNNKIEETLPDVVLLNKDQKANQIPHEDEVNLTVENEDEILNKHANITESSEAVEEMDPSLEESLLDGDDSTEIKLEASPSNSPKTTSESEVVKNQDERPIIQDIAENGTSKAEEISEVIRETSAVNEETSEANGETSEITKEPSEVTKETSEVTKETSEVTKETSEVKEEESDENNRISVSATPVEQNKPEQVSISESNFTHEKCDDNSNGSMASDTEDLLDISMIKDSAQDDADIAEDALQLQQENDDSNGNTDRNSKVNGVDTVDDSSNLDNSDEDVKDDYIPENQETAEMLQNEFGEIGHEDNKTDDNTEKELEEIHIEENHSTEDEQTLNEGILTNEGKTPNDIDNSDVFMKENHVDALNDHSNNIDKVAPKRTLSDENLESEPKKIKLNDEVKDENMEIDNWDITELQSLISFSKFMTKSRLKQLTRSDLEEFCVQKLCEAILHKSELGETNHQLKIQEQTIETLRKEQAVLTKQIKDLEIVNKKLMHEVRCSTGSKPIIPVKITRSVGLQVRLVQPNDSCATKRRPTQVTPQKQTSTTNSIVTNRSPRVTPTITVNRQVLNKSPQKASTPILNQVLQNRNTPTGTKTTTVQIQNNTPRPNLKSKATPEKRAKTSGFIDLTEEDDKKINKVQQNVQNALKAIVPQGVRINSIPKTTIPSVLSSVVSSSTPQVMYVVQSNSQIKQGLLTSAAGQPKAVLVNFQPTNGVIGSLNNSSVSVIPKVTGNVQLRTAGAVVKMKHPAPLPNPPQIQGPANKNLKGIPPKPELSIRKTNTGIILQWRMPYDLGLYEGIASYQLYAYQETSSPPSTDTWRKVGDVKAMALPMACTLTQFPAKNKYFFAVRPVDIHKRIGRFSDPEEISL